MDAEGKNGPSHEPVTETDLPDERAASPTDDFGDFHAYSADDGTGADEEDRGGYFVFENPRAAQMLDEEADYNALNAGDENIAAESSDALAADSAAVSVDAVSVSAGGRPLASSGESSTDILVSPAAGLSTAEAAAGSEARGGAVAGDRADGDDSSAPAPAGLDAGVAEGSADENDTDAVAAHALDAARIQELAAMRLSQLERDYSTTLAVEHGRSPAEAAAAAYAASLASSGVSDSSGAGATPADAKARKIAELRARLAASRAATAAAAISLASQATMQLAPGSEDFPPDYDELQRADHEAIQAQAAAVAGAGGGAALKGGVGVAAGAGAAASGAGSEPLVDMLSAGSLAATRAGGASAAVARRGGKAAGKTSAAAKAAADFDPFGVGGSSSTAASKGAPAALPARSAVPAAGPRRVPAPAAVRPVSPLGKERVEAIAQVMARIRIVPPRGAASAFTESAVAAALERGRAARAAYDAAHAAPAPVASDAAVGSTTVTGKE
jgi:hypothetical protein